MQKTNKILLILLLVLSAIMLMACGNENTADGGSGSAGGSGGSSDTGSENGGDEETGALSILAIGDISITECTEHLYDVLKAAGKEKITLATLTHNYTSGASLDAHYNNLTKDRAAYNLEIISDGKSDLKFSQRLGEVLASRKWDYVIIGQAVQLAGINESYDKLPEIISYIRENMSNESGKVLWNMTWAFDEGSTHEGFDTYGKDQEKMYADITDAVRNNVESAEGIDGIIPFGTAIQNLRLTLGERIQLGSGIRLKGEYGELPSYAAAIALCYVIGGNAPEADVWLPTDTSDIQLINEYKLAMECVMNAFDNKYEAEATEIKSIKLLIFGNSYGNDATAYLGKMLAEGGYVNVVIGHVGESTMAINDHYHNIDDDPTNDFIYAASGKPFSVHYKTVNGERVEMEADYKKIVADEDWDHIIFYQGPNSIDTLINEQYYSELDKFVAALRANMTNPDGKIIYYMPWIHGENNTAGYYKELAALTERLFLNNEKIDAIIPAGTMIQNLRTSYLDASATNQKWGDINRDWGHLNYGVGRYSLSLLFYLCLTDGEIGDISYIPTVDDLGDPSLKPKFTEVESNLDVIREAVRNALEKPLEITESVYKDKPIKE
ncbi:MAG: DUF4886 domain-containing protein [Clostridia bacterium]|nr:DUF4886 domain-containing protein [Clostridia bacterium]